MWPLVMVPAVAQVLVPLMRILILMLMLAVVVVVVLLGAQAQAQAQAQALTQRAVGPRRARRCTRNRRTRSHSLRLTAWQS